MAFKRGKFTTNSISSQSSDIGTVWIIRFIEENIKNEQLKFLIEIIPNRTTTTIKKFIEDHILPETTVKTDGWSSYPAAIRESNIIRSSKYSHEIVNHSIGFINERGTHANTIEGLWSHLR